MTEAAQRTSGRLEPALRRLAALADLDSEAIAALRTAFARARSIRPREEILSERRPVAARLILIEGWAARTRVLPDGRRQILNFALPGDLIGHCRQEAPLASSSLIALTRARVCVAPAPSTSPSLESAYAMSGALEESYQLSQIARLGRMSAHERILDAFLELSERLELAGLTHGGAFEMPVTQEMLADALGLTSVHINRMLQQSRKTGEISLSHGTLVLHDPDALRTSLGREPARVSEIWPKPVGRV